MISQEDVDRVAAAGRNLPPAENVYIETDYVTNLMATVIDYQTHSAAVEGAIGHFKANRWDEIRTIDDLYATFELFPETKEGNLALAQHLWGYNMWTRAEQLRRLTDFFIGVGVSDQASLKSWAETSTFDQDFRGQVRGLGPAVYQWLIMRQGVETVKPDVHVHRFVRSALGRSLSDNDAIEVVERAAHKLGLSALHFDWSIWEWSRQNPVGENPGPDPRRNRERPTFVCSACFATKPESLRSEIDQTLCIDCA